jgi:hypothetical protein
MSPRWIMRQVESTRSIIPRVVNILRAYSKLCVDHVIYYGALQIIVMKISPPLLPLQSRVLDFGIFSSHEKTLVKP